MPRMLKYGRYSRQSVESTQEVIRSLKSGFTHRFHRGPIIESGDNGYQHVSLSYGGLAPTQRSLSYWAGIDD
jgi:hypothetical protein